MNKVKDKQLLKLKNSVETFFKLIFDKCNFERGSSHDLINICSGKKLKPETTMVTVHLSLALFFCRSSPPKIALEGCCSKILQKDTQWVSDLVADYRPSYLNFEADISLEYLQLITVFIISCFIYYHFSNSHRIITSCSACVTR